MALINNSQLTALAEDIVPDVPSGASAEQIAARNEAVANTKNLCQKIMQYIIDQLEIKNINVSTGTLLTPPPIVTPSDGGATLFSSTLIPQINTKTLIQNNDGKGLVE